MIEPPLVGSVAAFRHGTPRGRQQWGNRPAVSEMGGGRLRAVLSEPGILQEPPTTTPPPPGELAPPPHARLRRLRPWARWLHVTLALAVVVAVLVQVYLIGAYIFGAGAGALNAHRAVGFTTNELEGAVLIAALLAWLPRTDLILSLLLALIGTAQVALASGHRWAGALDPLGALFVLTIAAVLVRRSASWRRADLVSA